MNIQLLQIPYDSGHKGLRAGRGPEHFLRHNVDQILRGDGHQVSSHRIESRDPFTTEIGTAFELDRLLAEQVRSAIRNEMFPIVLAGNCNSCLGTLAGIDRNSLGILWFDAHGDFNTPETTLSGFLDGMALAMATGRCWQSLLNTVPGFRAVPEANVIHIGARDLDPDEERLLQGSEIQVIMPQVAEGSIRNAVGTALNNFTNKAESVYLHIDMDVLDTGEALPNHFAVPGGLPVEMVVQIIAAVKEKFEVAAAAITSFDPDYDKDDQVLEAGIKIIQAFVS